MTTYDPAATADGLYQRVVSSPIAVPTALVSGVEPSVTELKLNVGPPPQKPLTEITAVPAATVTAPLPVPAVFVAHDETKPQLAGLRQNLRPCRRSAAAHDLRIAETWLAAVELSVRKFDHA